MSHTGDLIEARQVDVDVYDCMTLDPYLKDVGTFYGLYKYMIYGMSGIMIVLVRDMV